MSMLFFMIVMFTAIIGFFSKEFIHLFTRVFSIPGVKLVLPLLIVSLVVESYVLWGWWGLSSLRSILSSLENRLSYLIPFQTGVMIISRAAVLTVLACIPMWLAKFSTRKKPMSRAQYYACRVSAFIWVVAVIVLVT